MKIFPIIKKAGAPAPPPTGAGANAVGIQRLGIRLVTRLEYVWRQLAAGVRVSTAPLKIVMTAGARTGVSVSYRASGSTRSSQTAGIQVANRTTGVTKKPTALPAWRITRTMANLVHTRGATGWTETAVGGRSDWTNEVNATGSKNGTFATIVGNTLAARGGKLNLTYDDLTGKDAMTIRSVKLKLHLKMTGASALGLAKPVSFIWAKSGTETTLESWLVNFDHAAGKEYDITPSITGWADINAITTHVNVQLSLGETPTVSLDAIHLIVEADKTEELV